MLKKVLVTLVLAIAVAASVAVVPQMTGACEQGTGNPCP